MTNDWQPISTAPCSLAEEVLATDYDSIEIIHRALDGSWEDRDGNWYFPSFWQPLPDVPPLPEEP